MWRFHDLWLKLTYLLIFWNSQITYRMKLFPDLSDLQNLVSNSWLILMCVLYFVKCFQSSITQCTNRFRIFITQHIFIDKQHLKQLSKCNIVANKILNILGCPALARTNPIKIYLPVCYFVMVLVGELNPFFIFMQQVTSFAIRVIFLCKFLISWSSNFRMLVLWT